MPSRFTPRRMKGITVVSSLWLPARPMLAMLPQVSTVRVSQVSSSPPTLSMRAAPLRGFHRALAEVDVLAAQDARRAERLQVVVGLRLAADRDGFVAAAREQVDRDRADAAGRAGHDDRALRRRLAVVLHAMDRERRR